MFGRILIFLCTLCVGTEAAKEEEAEDLGDMDGFQTDDEDDDGDGSDKEMGVDAEDGDEADSIKLHKLAAQVWSFSHISFLMRIHGFLTPYFLQYAGDIGSLDIYFVFIGNEY